jgi:alpha-beta hydrolase superfamily lysophospholipase
MLFDNINLSDALFRCYFSDIKPISVNSSFSLFFCFQMLLNKFLFPAPKPPHYTATSHRQNLFWLPADSINDSPIPCMFYSPEYSNQRIEHFIVFCHGNGCDIGSMQYTLSEFSKNLNVYAISFEYPSYGLCEAQSPNQQTINNHADRTFNFVRDTLHWPTERIIVYGHSIGSGAACHLASTHSIAALILQSPYTAIRNLVKEKVGSVLSFIVNSRSWDNLEAMKEITCPILFIHGLNDTLIPSNHSEVLFEACSNTEGKKIVLLRNEDHNSMTEQTLLKYIKPFIEKQCRSIDTDKNLPIVEIDRKLRELPSSLKPDNENTSSNGVFSSLYSMSKVSTAATVSSIRSISGKGKNEPNENE